MSTTQDQQTNMESVAVAGYEAPAITTLGTLAELTLSDECYPGVGGKYPTGNYPGAYKNDIHKEDFSGYCVGSH
jgi:hypothetical protein